MGLCKKLNCCQKHSASETNIVGPKDDKDTANNGLLRPDSPEKPPNGNIDAKSNPEPTYAKVNKPKPSPDPMTSPQPPVRGEFLVSFVVDSRGGAMTGCRGSGLRLIIPPGAVEQPVRVTCRYVKSHAHNMPLVMPNLMERDALAAGIVEVGPAGTKFKVPVLVEIPHFAALGSGDRNLLVLRSDDGEMWKEHTSSFSEPESGWGTGEEGDLYQDVVASTDLNKVTEDLETGRIVRLSASTFPKYFAVLSRPKGEVAAIGADGGTVRANSQHGQVAVYFPPDSLKKRIKIGLQVQNVPHDLVQALPDRDGLLDVYPLIGVYPRRRKFHHAIEISIPVMSDYKGAKKIWILCSLSNPVDRAKWEDVTESASVIVRGKKLVFETKVSALFWILTTKEDSFNSERLLEVANGLYKELTVAPYIARFSVFHRPQFPFSWCDALRVYCAVNDRHESYIEAKDADNWVKIIDGKEVEVDDRATYVFEALGDMHLANECQLEAKLDDRLIFKSFNDNSVTLLVNWNSRKTGDLLMKKQSRVIGATKKDAFHHTTWHIDVRSSEEKVKDQEEDKKGKRLSDHLYDEVGQSSLPPIEVEAKVQSEDMVNGHQEVEQMEQNEYIDNQEDMVNGEEEHAIEINNSEVEEEEQVDPETRKLYADIAEAVAYMPTSPDI